MSCPNCRADLQPGQTVCPRCGVTLTESAAPAGPATTVVSPTMPPPPPAGALPQPSGSIPPPPAGRVAPMPTGPVFAPPPPSPTASFTIIEQTPPPGQTGPWAVGGVATAHDAAPLTGAQPTLVQPATDRFYPSSPPLTATAVHAATPLRSAAPAIDETRANRGVNIAFGILASLAGLAMIIGSLLPMLTIRTDSSVPSGDFDLDDIFGGSNLQIAFIIAGVALIAGAVISNFRYRFGAGLSGGTALVLIPYLAYVWGLTRIVSDHAQASAVASGQGTFIETTTGVGFFVLAAAVVLGFVAMLVGLAFAGYDTLPPLNRLICMGGALGGIAAGVGQLIPGSGASLSDNFDTGFMGSAWIVYSRLGIMAAIIVATMVGFLRCNRWGVGFAVGSIVIYVWQWISSVADWGTQPLPPAFGNPGGDLKPTAVTTIGLVAVIGFGALALLVGGRREPLVQPTTVMMPDYRQSA